MEFLVDMVTTVPAGTTEQAVADLRAREAARSRNWPRRAACCACGGRRSRPVNGAPGACSARPMRSSWSRSWRRCRCGCGDATR